MKVRDALQIRYSVSTAWPLGPLMFAAWWSFSDDRPAVGSYLLLIIASLAMDWFKAFADRRIVELQRVQPNDGDGSRSRDG